MVFFLTQENAYLKTFHFKANRKNNGSSKNGTSDFESSPPFKRLTYFYVTITGNFERFHYFDIETSFLKNENIF